MVLAGEEFEVRDAKSGEDLTRSILLQIILEEESGAVQCSAAARAPPARWQAGRTWLGSAWGMTTGPMTALDGAVTVDGADAAGSGLPSSPARLHHP